MKIKVKFSETGNIFAVKVQEEEKTFTAHFKDVVMVDGHVDLTGYATEEWVMDGYQPKGDYLTAVPDGYAKTEDIPTKPEDIGAQPSGNYALKTEIPFVPVQSVNGKTGAVQLSAADVKARPETWMPSAQDVGALPNTYIPPNQTSEQVGADPKGSAASAVSQHNTADDSHNDIRLEVKAINNRLAAFFDSDNQTLDELSEIVAYITNNKTLIDSITTSKVSVTDIINNLTTNVTNKPLSAAQGVVLKGLIDALSNSLLNYQPKGNYLTSFTETDPTVPSWAKASSKPSYSKSEVGLGNVDNVKQYSASNPPPYPVTSVNGKTGAVTVSVPTKVSQLQNDAGYLTQHQDISGKLDASALPSAINTALEQAKESGKFDGSDGKDGYTPQKNVDYFDGKDGADGKDGTSATHSWNGTTLTITSASGTSSADLKGEPGKDGNPGKDGSAGADGVSPTVAVSKSGKVTTVSITDKNGTKTATINDGADGSPGSAGKDGTSVTVKSTSESTADGGSNIVTFSDGKSITIKNGSKGIQGDSGVYVGSEEPTDQSIIVWVNPDGDADSNTKIPDYVVNEAESVIDRVMTAQTSGRVFTMIALSDMHYGSGSYTDGVKHAAQAIKHIEDRIGIDALAVLGDYTDRYINSEYTNGIADVYAVNGLLSEVDADMLPLVGNHDYHSDGSPQIARAILGKSDNVVWGDRAGGYYYRDFNDYKLRVIAVNTSEAGGGNICCSTKQYNWFASTLDMSAKEDADEWQILILSHHPLDWYENANDGVYRFAHILDAYANGKSWSGGGVSCNFAEKNAAQIVGNVHGHIHNLLVDKIRLGNPVNSTEQTDIYRMCIPEACLDRPQSYGGVWDAETVYAKTANTATDTAFTVLCIDLDNYTINAVNYGAGIDRTVVYHDPTKPNYKNMLESAINSDGTPYRGTNGEIGYKAGYRLNSSGAEAQNGDYYVTGYIPIHAWDYVYLKNMNLVIGDTTAQPNTRVVTYDAQFNSKRIALTGSLSADIFQNLLDENGGAAEVGDAIGRLRYVEGSDDTVLYYIRFSTKKIDDTSVVTVNEEIV